MAAMRKHVAVCAFPWTSHPTALLLLVRRIATAAPEVRFTFFNTQESNLKLFGDETDAAAAAATAAEVPAGNIWPYTVDNGIPEGYVFSSPNKLQESIGLFMGSVLDNIRKSIRNVEEEVGMKIECVISDVFLWFCGKIAEERNVDWVGVWNGSPHSLSAHLHTDVIRSKIGVNGKECRPDDTLDFIPGFSVIRASDVPKEMLSEEGFDTPIGQTLYNGALNLPQATAVVIPCFEELEPVIVRSLKSKLPNLLCTGLPFLSMHQGQTLKKTTPEHQDDPYGCLQWLDNHEPASVAYISFGTLGIVAKQDLVALAQALDHTNIPFLWSLTDDAKAKLHQRFVEKATKDGIGKFVTWAPQMAVLAHDSVGVTITHCGWNSFLESLVNVVPLICRPSFADQMLNTRFVVSEYRVGIEVEDGNNFTSSGMEAALEEVLKGREGYMMRERLRKLKELAQESARPGGSSANNFKTLVNMAAK